MPTETYELISQTTLAASATDITFGSIPQTYRDLVLIANWQNSGNSSATRLRVNNDSGANYNGVLVAGTGSTTSSGSESNQTSARVGGAVVGPHNTFSNVLVFNFMDYSATDKHKTILSRYGSANTETQATASRWASTSAITSIFLFDVSSQTFAAGSTFALYGIAS